MSDKKTTTKKKRITRAEAQKRFLKFRSRETSMENLAKAIGVSVNYIYGTLIPEISRETGIPREELLYKPSRSSVVNPKTPGKTSKKEAVESMNEADSDDFVGTLEGISDVAAEAKEDAKTTAEISNVAEVDTEGKIEVKEEPGNEEQEEICDNEMLKQILAVLKETKSIIDTMITRFQEVYQK